MVKSALLADSSDLAVWAKRLDSKAHLPTLIRRLVFATLETDQISSVEFRSDEGVHLGGWDGLVTATKGNAFVPRGLSAWELGTESDIKGKADSDYETRTKNPAGRTRRQTTYVAVTLRRWKNKRQWADAKRKTKAWRDVRAYDVDDIATWLEQAPSVHLWISRHLGKTSVSAESLASFWESWRATTRPQLPFELLIAGRQRQVEQFQEFLTAPASAKAVKGPTSDESIAFIASAIRSLPAAESERVFARSMVIHQPAAWQELTTSSRNLILIPTFAEKSLTLSAVESGHHVILPLAGNEPDLGNTILLPRIGLELAKAALGPISGNDAQVEEYASLARSGLGALRRRLALHGSALVPRWATGEAARTLVPALLAGEWDDELPADQAIVASLAGVSYTEYRNVLDRWTRETDPPIRRIAQHWIVTAKDDAWSLLSRYISDDDLEKFEKAVIAAVGEHDPQFDMPAEERVYARVRGSVPKHSRSLRRSLADTLALMAAATSIFPLESATLSGADTARRIVAHLLEKTTTGRAWSSLADNMKAIAEAAPEAFLSTIDRHSFGDGAILPELFASDEPALVSGLLWALEALAWKPEYLGTVGLALARLARSRMLIQSRSGKDPLGSLTAIFLLWHPGTVATLSQRLRVIDMIRRQVPEISWQVLVRCLPRSHSLAFPTGEPHRRDWVPDAPESQTWGDIASAISEVVRRLREDAGTSGKRWQALIEILDSIPEPAFDSIVEDLSSLSPDALARGDRTDIRDGLRKLVDKHRRHPDASWAIPKRKLTPLEVICQRYESAEPVDPLEILFSRKTWNRAMRSKEYQARIAELKNEHIRAVSRLLKASGASAVLSLGTRVEQPGSVGLALGETLINPSDEDLVLQSLAGAAKADLGEFGVAFLRGRIRKKGRRWVERFRKRDIWTRWNSSERAAYFRQLPYDMSTWKLLTAESRETQIEYWRTTTLFAGTTPIESSHISNELVRFGLGPRAIDALAACSRIAPGSVSAAQAIEALDAGARAASNFPTEGWRDLALDVAHLIDIVEDSPSFDSEQSARLELHFFPLIHHMRPSRAVFDVLARDPQSYVDLLTCIYCPSPGATGDLPKKPTSIRADVAFRLLQEWRSPPGTLDDGKVDAASLRRWVLSALKLANDAGCGEPATSNIGQLLSSVPQGSDGIWPHEAVRELIEELRSDCFERGVASGNYNLRNGEMEEVGRIVQRERQASTEYRRNAGILADEWPRTAALLLEIAQDCDRGATRQEARMQIDEDRSSMRRPIRPRTPRPEQLVERARCAEGKAQDQPGEIRQLSPTEDASRADTPVRTARARRARTAEGALTSQASARRKTSRATRTTTKANSSTTRSANGPKTKRPKMKSPKTKQ